MSKAYEQSELDPEKRLQIDMLRDIILSVEPKLQEHIKWNAPSYVLNGEDRITFNLMNKESLVKLILHMGATRKEDKKGDPIMNDESGLVHWSSDIRGTLTFMSIEDIRVKTEPLKKIIRDWLTIPSSL